MQACQIACVAHLMAWKLHKGKGGCADKTQTMPAYQDYTGGGDATVGSSHQEQFLPSASVWLGQQAHGSSSKIVRMPVAGRCIWIALSTKLRS